MGVVIGVMVLVGLECEDCRLGDGFMEFKRVGGY